MSMSGKQKRSTITAVTGELMSSYGMTYRQAKLTVRRSPLRKAMKLFPEQVLHSSTESLAADVMAGT